MMGRMEPKRPVRKVPAIQPSFEARLRAARRALPRTFALDNSFLDADRRLRRESISAAVTLPSARLLLTGIITYEEEAKLPLDERFAAMEARLQVDSAEIPA